MKSVLVVLALTYSTASFAQGGASTVGDGGHGVDCRNSKRMQLLDLYEFGNGKKVSLPDSQSARKSFPVLLARAKAALQLTEGESRELALAAKRFFNFAIDPWAMELRQYSYFLRAKEPILSPSIEKKLEDEDCVIEPIVIRPDPNAKSLETYDYLCSQSHAGLQHCFLVNMRGYRKLSKPQQACLVLHESLRFLPTSKQLNEVKLRAMTAQLCTQ